MDDPRAVSILPPQYDRLEFSGDAPNAQRVVTRPADEEAKFDSPDRFACEEAREDAHYICEAYSAFVKRGGVPSKEQDKVFRKALELVQPDNGAELESALLATKETDGPRFYVPGILVGMQEITRQAERPLPWLIDGLLLGNSTTVIYGPPKQYKTFLGIEMALSQATGLPFLGKYPVRKHGLVVYVAGEGLEGCSQRVIAWCTARGIVGSNVYSVPFWRSNGPLDLSGGDAARLARECDSLQRKTGLQIVGIYVDTLARNFGDGDESRTQDMNRFVRQCDQHLREPFGAAVVIIHHTGHASPDRARGSTALMASADCQIRVSSRAGKIVVKYDFMKDAEPPNPIVLTPRTVRLRSPEEEGDGFSVESLVLEFSGEAAADHIAELTREEKIALQPLSKDWCRYEEWRGEFVEQAAKMPARKGPRRGAARSDSSLRSAVSRVLKSLERKKLIEVNRSSATEIDSIRLADED